MARADAPQAANDALVVSGWWLQDATKVAQDGSAVSAKSFRLDKWYAATVPGTVLTTLVNNHVYPEPLYGENNRPEVIPESLARTSFWYRAGVSVPQSYAGRHVWLNLDGINYSAAIWVNGRQVGKMRGAFARGQFDITSDVKAGQESVIAILVTPQPHPGVPHEHTLSAGMGHNGGITAIDGPTFMSTIGWDWIPAIRDRDTGLWQKVFLSTSGPVVIKNPQVTADLQVPGFSKADVTVRSELHNVTNLPQKTVLEGFVGEIHFEQTVELAPHERKVVVFDPSNSPALSIPHPRLWWPNGYGPQNLYHLQLKAEVADSLSESKDVDFGVRKITYTVPTTDSLAFVVNGVPIFIRGGDWGLDDAMKRVSPRRLEAQIKMHQLAHLNMIRNWVGQSTSEDFFALCDKYGLLVWDEFFQPNPGDGPNPVDTETYIANVRDTILRYRNHPSIALWCARNEGNPPKEIDAALRKTLAELDPTRMYQANSSDGRGVRSHGPYRWRVPRDMYWLDEGFKSETGTISIPTLESIQGMLPEKDWSMITDAWAEHDFADGAARGDIYPGIMAQRYGEIKNLADFVRKAQLMNFEDYRAMYEARNAEMFHPTTGILTWMSHPAQPSFVWQLYHYDLEPNSSLFAVQSASESLHIQLNEVLGKVQVVNNHPEPLRGTTAQVEVFNLDGTKASSQSFKVNAAGSSVTDAGQVEYHEPLTQVHFLRLRWFGAGGNLLSENFYWHNHPERADMFSDLNNMPLVTLVPELSRTVQNGKVQLRVTLRNPTANIALMAHLQLHGRANGKRILPVFYTDNYVSLIGGASRTIVIEADEKDMNGDEALVLVDGWNIAITPVSVPGLSIAINRNAQVKNWSATGLQFQKEHLR